ncbi:MAG: tetratricopeptide repeat protein [Pseudomonadota bacterium]
MKKTLITIAATFVGTIAILILGLYGYYSFEMRQIEPYSETMTAFYGKLEAKDHGGAEKVLLDALADERFSDPFLKFEMHGTLARLYSAEMKNFGAAERQYLAALALDPGAEVPMADRGKLNLLTDFAVMLDDGGRYPDAVARLEQALRIVQDSDPALKTRIFMSLGIAHVHNKDFDRGEFYLEETRKRIEAQPPSDLRDLKVKALAYNNLAWMYQRKAQFEKALSMMPQAFRVADVLGDVELNSTLNDTQAQILLVRDSDYLSAVNYRTHGKILAALDRTGDACKSLAKARDYYAKAANEQERAAAQQEAAAFAC